jgi:endonuclease/exonuclease/phosphatase (EEP) superfamily protein YafD
MKGTLTGAGRHGPPRAIIVLVPLTLLVLWVGSGNIASSLNSLPGCGLGGDPVVLAGDLNAIPYSAQIRRFHRAGLQDAWSAVHLHPNLTWSPSPALPRIARLDCIMAGEPLSIRGCWVLGVPGSDHCLVTADIDIKEEG